REARLAHGRRTGGGEGGGVAVSGGARGVDTAFEATAGSAGPTIAVLCEYDALPGIGHARGDNVIAAPRLGAGVAAACGPPVSPAAGLGAGVAAAALADELGGRLLVVGSPAEEGGGGKVRL